MMEKFFVREVCPAGSESFLWNTLCVRFIPRSFVFLANKFNKKATSARVRVMVTCQGTIVTYEIRKLCQISMQRTRTIYAPFWNLDCLWHRSIKLSKLYAIKWFWSSLCNQIEVRFKCTNKYVCQRTDIEYDIKRINIMRIMQYDTHFVKTSPKDLEHSIIQSNVWIWSIKKQCTM